MPGNEFAGKTEVPLLHKPLGIVVSKRVRLRPAHRIGSVKPDGFTSCYSSNKREVDNRNLALFAYGEEK
jgi:hypothetical protein